MPQYRHELKFYISKSDADILKKQLSLVCELDSHSVATDYSYDIRSLYFDDVFSSGYNDKIDGVAIRKKYRIRIYNGSDDIIKLECKHKDIDMTLKEECSLSLLDAKKIISGDLEDITANDELLSNFKLDAKLFGLRPSVIVDYRRLSFVHPVSNVRITFDEDIKSGRFEDDLFSKTLNLSPVEGNEQIELEIKCNEFIPEHILAVLNSVPKCRIALSKYALAYETKYSY